MKPLSRDFIIDLITGKIKVIIGLDLDSMIELFNKIGLETEWASKKATANLLKKSNRDLFVLENQAIVLKAPNQFKFHLCSGILSKIIYDNILPSSIAIQIFTSNSGQTST